MNVPRGKRWVVACVLLLSATAALCSGSASADPVDDAFIASLVNYGIEVRDSGTAIAMAHRVCTGFDNNANASVLAMKVMRDTDLTMRESGYFIGLSVAAYCPQYRGLIDTSLIWLIPGPPLM
ncbi:MULTISPECIES: DUF732 domain-containing protein [unclassified Mycobacterium]|uniref:DUF732 domain-containing protein n=1 Tax=unclassified Mycobacterium TaxID=2642494 RepID=UPI0007FC7E39|nr:MULTISPECIES: DUF732 domain-containing protein [unclassified Mycobacterium]OBG98342.1 hypothetical protein A9X04_03955 [Mycobacterium sp. E3247]OBI19097.1 hypothetical protein A5713_16600 [Mycobacterium sp. E2497]